MAECDNAVSKYAARVNAATWFEMAHILLNRAMAKFKKVDEIVAGNIREEEPEKPAELDESLRNLLESESDKILDTAVLAPKSNEEPPCHVQTATFYLPEQCKKFSVRLDETPLAVYRYLAEKEGVQVSEILLFTSADQRILCDKTLRDQELKASVIVASHEVVRKARLVQFFIQTSTVRSKQAFKAGPNQPLRSFLEGYAAKHNYSFDQVRFSFDGVALSGGETPAALDFEGDEVIDMRPVQKQSGRNDRARTPTDDDIIILD